MYRIKLCYFSAAPSHLKKLDIIQKIASRIITNSPQGTHSAPLQALLGLDSLNSRRQRHIAKIATNIASGRIHPYFKNIFPSNTTMLTPLSTNSTSFSSRSLNSKRFSQFAPLVVQEISQPDCTVTRALEPLSVGRSIYIVSSYPDSQLIPSVITAIDSTSATVAPFGHRDRKSVV